MATILVNTPDSIQFVDASVSLTKQDSPTLSVQSGDWETDDHLSPGIVFDVFGPQAPMLTPTDARKLAKWLTRAADLLDGVKHSDKKNKHRRYYDDDGEDELN